MELKNLISESKETKVYKCDKYAVKVYEEGVPKTEVLNTALVHSLVEGTGLSVPKIREVSRIDGKWAISTKYVEGKNLRQLMEENNLKELPAGKHCFKLSEILRNSLDMKTMKAKYAELYKALLKSSVYTKMELV